MNNIKNSTFVAMNSFSKLEEYTFADAKGCNIKWYSKSVYEEMETDRDNLASVIESLETENKEMAARLQGLELKEKMREPVKCWLVCNKNGRDVEVSAHRWSGDVPFAQFRMHDGSVVAEFSAVNSVIVVED